MLPSSHPVLIEPQVPSSEAALLAEAFSDFLAASSRLEHSYRDLQAEVAELNLALAEQNRALLESRSENKSLGERLQHILDAVPCGVLVLEQHGSVLLANPEAQRLLALCGDNPAHVRALGTRTALNLEICASLPEDDEEQEFSFDGTEGRTWIGIRRVTLQEANFLSRREHVLTLRDISARKRMELEREAARDAVALAQVSALLAHEIRNPLASLELFASLLEENTDRRDEWLSHLRAGIRSLSGTVNNVLTLQGQTTLELEAVDVFTEARLAVEFLQPLAQQAEVSLALATEGSACARSLQILGNRSAFHQIILNLCSNAVRHTRAGGSVKVCCIAPCTDSAPIRVTVVDNGRGIPAEHLTRLFEAGFSVSGTTSGLGLAVCDRLLRQVGGSIQVQSQVGQGSTFVVEFPQA